MEFSITIPPFLKENNSLKEYCLILYIVFLIKIEKSYKCNYVVLKNI